jgi:hypothetical protein
MSPAKLPKPFCKPVHNPGWSSVRLGAQLREWSVYGINRLDLGSLAAVVSILLVAAVIASYLPARRSSKVHPIIALPQE